MLNNNQVNSLKHIYQLFSNVFDNALIWASETKESDETDLHIEKLSLIMNIISDFKERLEGDLDDIIIIVEENLKEYILEKYSEDVGNEDDTESEMKNI